MSRAILASLPLLVLSAAVTLGQKPEFSSSSVVNAASYQPVLAPGSIATIFGKNLAVGTEEAKSLPLPRSLAGTVVRVGQTLAPLFYVSPAQINFQFPSSPGFALTVTVFTPVGTSDAVPIATALGTFAPFTLDASGCGPALVFNVDPVTGSLTLNTPDNSARPGQYVTIFGTGLGIPNYWQPILDGEPSPPGQGGRFSTRYFGLSSGIERPFPSFDADAGEVRPDPNGGVIWEGRTPGFVALDQLNVVVGGAEGCNVPMRVESATLSQPFLLNISKEGGRCKDIYLPYPSGRIRLQKTIFPFESRQTEELIADFRLVLSGGRSPFEPIVKFTTPPAPRCREYEDRRFEAGVVTLTGSTLSVPVTVPPRTWDGGPIYQANLPAGTLRGGEFRISVQGAGTVKPFRIERSQPDPISVTTNLAPGAVLTPETAVIRWTGGTTGMVIATIRQRQQPKDYFVRDIYQMARAPASEGVLRFVDPNSPNHNLPIWLGQVDDLEVSIWHEGEDTFRTEGLSEGFSSVTFRWRYEFHYLGLKGGW